MTKNCFSCFISQEPHIMWLSFMVPMCKMIISLVFFLIFNFLFFHLFKILIFWVVRGVKGQKWSKSTKYLSITLDISGNIHFMIVIYVHMCKMIMSPGVFSVFQNFNFWVVSGVKEQKMAKNNIKFCLSCFISQELNIIWLSFMVLMCKIIISPGFIVIFSECWFFGLLGG